MTTKLEALTQRLNDDPALSDALSEYLREHAAERDALRAEVERLRESVHMACGSCGTPTNPDILVCPQCHDGWIVGNGAEFLDRATETLRAEVERLRRESVPMCVPTAEGFRRVGGRRLLAAAQSLHRAWKRERAELALLRAFVSALRSDGLDIDDPAASPTWTGKIHVGGRLVFDLATVDEPPSEREPMAVVVPRACTWCGKVVSGASVVHWDAAGEEHLFHPKCVLDHARWASGLVKDATP